MNKTSIKIMVKLVEELNKFERQANRKAKAVYVSPEIYQRLRHEMRQFGEEPDQIAGISLEYDLYTYGDYYFI